MTSISNSNRCSQMISRNCTGTCTLPLSFPHPVSHPFSPPFFVFLRAMRVSNEPALLKQAHAPAEQKSEAKAKSASSHEAIKTSQDENETRKKKEEGEEEEEEKGRGGLTWRILLSLQHILECSSVMVLLSFPLTLFLLPVSLGVTA